MLLQLDPDIAYRSRPEASRSVAASRAWRVSALPAVLEEILAPEVNLTCWQRPIPSGTAESLAEWASDSGATFEATLPADSYSLAPALAGLQEEPLRTWLLADMAGLLDRFVCLAGADRFRLSFGVVRDDQCRKFHVDHHRYRLVTTYAGPGTEWVPNEAVQREALKHPTDCASEANMKIVRDPGSVHVARAGDVLLIKGAGHESVLGAVHRSPPLQGSGLTRVVLVASTVNPS